MPIRRDAIILTALTLATTVVAAWMAQTGRATWLEAVSFVTGTWHERYMGHRDVRTWSPLPPGEG